MVLHEFDEAIRSTFEPDEVVSPVEGMPKIGVTCFSHKLMDRLITAFDAQVIAHCSGGNGKLPVYRIRYAGRELALFLSRIGAPACVVRVHAVKTAFVIGSVPFRPFGQKKACRSW